jgi:hypothetical protein
MFLSELAEADRKHVKLCIRMLLARLRSCDARLQTYEADNVDPPENRTSQTVFKLLQELKEVSVMVDEMKNELVERHRLPNDLKQIDDGLRRDFRNLLLGIPMK